MSIHESLHFYNIGQLVFQTTTRLKTGLQVLENKIEYMHQVAKQGSVAAEVYADLRKYEKVREAIVEALEVHKEAELSIKPALPHTRARWS